MKRLVIIGAGGFGRETHQWAQDMNKVNLRWNEIVFIDDNAEKYKGQNFFNKIVCSIDDYSPKANDEMICAIGDTFIKKKICTSLEQKRVIFTNVIHPSAVISESAKISCGVVVCPHSVVSVDSVIGKHVIINTLTSIGHDAKVKEFSTISSHCDVMGGVSIGSNVFMGSNAIILPNKKVENNAIVGAGSVVLRRVKEGTTVFGNPARMV